MLYLEDYLEFIENLPQEFRQSLTSMRELDLQVDNEQGRMNKQLSEFFSSCATLPLEKRDSLYEQLCKDYSKMLEMGEEKITMAKQMHELIGKYHKKLEQELHKFKIELEADHAGITESLEQRFTSSQVNHSLQANQIREKRKNHSSGHDSSHHKHHSIGRLNNHHQTSAVTNNNLNYHSVPLPDNCFSLEKLQTNPTLAMASQALNASQFQLGGRKSMNPKATFDMLNASFGNTLYNLNSSCLDDTLDGSSGGLGYLKNVNDENDKSLPKKARANKRNRASSSVNMDPTNSNSNTNLSDSVAGPLPDDNNDEPRYCFCNGISYGDMIFCENRLCPYQWFHYACVNIQVVPEGSWFCPNCRNSKKKKEQ